MPFKTLSSTTLDTGLALAELERAFATDWSGGVDLAIVLFSGHHLEEAEQIASRLNALTSARALIGCPGETIIADDLELERTPALTLWLARWATNVSLTPYHLTFEQTADGASLLGWPDDLGEADPTRSLLLVLGDPFTFPSDDFLQQSNDEKPGLPIIGGMASASHQPGVNRLVMGANTVEQGAIGVLLQGDFPFRAVVSQGCRPIGKPLIVTKAHHNLIVELGGKPALAQLQEIWQSLDPADQQLVRQGLHVGLVINEYQDSFQRGDFLVRNVMGIEQSSGAVAITDRVRVGQTVQFHIRDAATADEDLRQLLSVNRQDLATPAGALLFSCNGRGTRLFPVPHHDARLVRNEMDDVPLAGFFAMGEIGPVGGRNFMHGFTASVVVFGE